ncbi:MAG: hypothetical protein JNL57_03620 [Bacteroidetes bacterium]|nr:hypothetical protein [Bacteroidota bacterium]
MKLFINLFRFLCFATLALSSSLQAQDKNIPKARVMLSKKQYAKALSMAESGIKKDKTLAEWYYIKASAEYLMSMIPKYRNGEKDYFREAVKTAVKARQRDKDDEYYDAYDTIMQGIVKGNNRTAMASYAQASYSRAIQMYRNSYELTGDTLAFGWMGMSYWGNKEERDALRILKIVARWNFDAHADGVMKGTYMREPFEVLSNYYLEKGYPDSALQFTEMGLEVYPNNIVMLRNMKDLILADLDEAGRIALDANYIQIINRGLGYFPQDSLFLREQNRYYLTRLGNATQEKPWINADTILLGFWNAKKDEIAAGVKNSYDDFLIADSAGFMFHCLDYYLRTAARGASAYFFKKWYCAYNRQPVFTEALTEKLLQNPPENISRRLITFLFADAAEDFPKNKKIKTFRLDYFRKWTQKPLHKNELAYALEFADVLVKDNPADKGLKEKQLALLVQNTDSAIAGGKMYIAWKSYNRIKQEFSTYKNLSALHLKLAKADFENRYSETRIWNTTVKGKKIPNTGWNGESASCVAGYLPDSTLGKIIDRINYFRQNAGILNPMALSMDRVDKCQKAAIMFAGRGPFTREPTEATHPCFSDEGAEAAAIGQAILEPNPSIGVTLFMEDKKSDEMVNRRTILNPGSLYAGVGCAENNSFYWLLDLGATADSNYYKTNFVTWPSAGYSPKMLAFRKWTFSMNQDLRDAKVTVKNKTGVTLDVKTSVVPLPGLNLQTLTMDCGIEKESIVAGDWYDLQIELKNKKKFNYRVQFF